ncbi:hypothetical protein BS50DRAFT_486448 [Corynespora cassiicola Philippines]|uniref:Carbohydrate esterase family 16 protein n=1 Tax=Corynespora cassiicola Philippines TaxID=1448308 RepID=A0A2T2P154_CORCC|nr:hypothetical protein BS50DRAFT_486448 [Corynespora cassiicola Philippines]
MKRAYNGFPNLEKLFIFGDSYTRNNFDPSKTQPSPSNPTGNGQSSSSNGEIWPTYLTTTYNASTLLTYNFARAGATIDEAIVDSNLNVDLVGQIASFKQYYNATSFDPATSVFALWIGINDCVNGYLSTSGDPAAHNADLIARYYELAEELHGVGARNFLFVNVPPLWRAPRVAGSSANATRVPAMRECVGDYNARLGKMVRSVDHDFAYSTVWVYDALTLFGEVMDEPGRFEETAVYRNTVGTCAAYSGGTEEWDDKYDECEFAASEYFWLDSLHPTQPIHQLLAKEIAGVLAG